MPSSAYDVVVFRRKLDKAAKGQIDVNDLYKTIRKLIKEEVRKYHCPNCNEAKIKYNIK